MTRQAFPLLQSSQRKISRSQISLLQLDPTSIASDVAVTGLYELSRQLCRRCAAFESLRGNWTCMTRLPKSRERQQRYYFHTIYRYLQDWGLDNNLVVIIVARTASGTMHMVERCTRCVNQGRLMDVKIAGFIKHWRRKGRTEMRGSRYSYQWALLTLTLIIEHCNISTTMVTHDRHSWQTCLYYMITSTTVSVTEPSAQLYSGSINQTLRSMNICASLIFCTPLTLECIHPTLWTSR